MSTLTVRSQTSAIVLGVAGLVFAGWAFEQAWERRGKKRPKLARWLAV